MYKVFIKDTPVFLIEDINSFSEIKAGLVMQYDGTESLKYLLSLLETQNIAQVVIFNNSLSELWSGFTSLFKIIEAAGGLVSKPKNEILFIKRYGKWDLPKGKLEKNEAVEDAAIREVEEECNISGLKIIKPLHTTYHTYIQDEKHILKFSHWFHMECSLEKYDLKPQIEEGITEVKWLNRDEIQQAMKNTYSTIKDTVDLFFNIN